MADEIDEGCSFKTVRTENMGYCPNQEVVGGVKADMYYTPMDQLQTVTKPVVLENTSYEDGATLLALVPVVGKGFKKTTCMIDENELKNNLVGTVGNMKDQAQFDGMLPNFIKKNVGFIKRHKNTPMCYVVVDSIGQKWVVLDAYITKADATTAKKYEENSGTAFNVTARSGLYAFDGEIVVAPDTASTPVTP